MKVLQVLQRPQRRGAEIFAKQLSEWLEKLGHQTRSVYLYPHDGKQLETQPSDVLLSGRERSVLEKVPGLHPGLLARLREVVREFQPDIIQVNGARTVKYGAGLRLLAPRPPWRIVYRNIDSPKFWVRGTARRLFYRQFVMRSIDGVVGVSRRTLDEVSELYGPSVPKLHIANGVDLAALRPARDRAAVRAALDTRDDAVVAIFIGNLGPQKRPDRFLEVLAGAGRGLSGLQGWLLGDGPDRTALEARVGELGLEGRVRFLGYQEHVADFMAAADVYVSTSDTEGIPAVVAETAYLGLPTLGFSVGGMPECVLEGRTGQLYPPGSTSQLMAGLIGLATDSERRRTLGRQAREWALDNYSIERVGAEYLNFYRRLLGQ